MSVLTASELDGLVQRLSARARSAATGSGSMEPSPPLGPAITSRLVGVGLLQVVVTVLTYSVWLFPIMAIRDGAPWSGWWAGWPLAAMIVLWSRHAALAVEQRVARECCAALRCAVLSAAIRGRALPGGAIAVLQETADAETVDAEAVRASCIFIAAAVEVVGVGVLALWIGYSGLAVGIGTAFAGACVLVARLRLAAARERNSRMRCDRRVIERLAAQRTWRIQGGHEAGDRLTDELARAADQSVAHDRAARLLCVVPSSALLAIGTVVAFGTSRPGSDNPDVLVPIAATLLASMALLRLGQAATVAIPAVAAFASVVAGAAAGREPGRDEAEPPCAARGHLALVAHELYVRRSDREKPILEGCSLAVGVGERVRILGRNGAGRSSLVDVLAGRRPPSAGVLLPRAPIDARADVPTPTGVAAPLIGGRGLMFSGTLLWNLTMPTGGSATAEDRSRAESVLVDLGLGELLSKMPAKLDQWVGEGGWRFSDGELARLQVARALLQQGSIILLDDPFSALDPLARETCELVITRTQASVVLAEPA